MDGDDVRQISLGFPEAAEKLTWEVHPTFRVRDKIFAILSEDGTSVRLKAEKEAQAALVGSDPETFFMPSHVARFGWVGVHLGHVDPGELRELLEDAWRLTAPKRVVAAYDAG